jgi:hypothetical protein
MCAPVMLVRGVVSLMKPNVARNDPSVSVTPSFPGRNPKGTSTGRKRLSIA